MKKTLFIVSGILIVVAGAWIVVSMASPAFSPQKSLEQPKITWSQPAIDVTLSPGESRSFDIAFSSNLPLNDIVIEPVPEIAPYLIIQPSSFAAVPASSAQSIRVTSLIPGGSSLGTYEGTVHVQSGSQTFAQTLKVHLDVWNTFKDTTLGITASYPSKWYIRQDGARVVISNTPTTGTLSNTALQVESRFEIRILRNSNPGVLEIGNWFDQHFVNGFSAPLLARATASVGGKPALRIETSEIGRRVHLYVPKGTDVIEIAYGLFAPQFVDEYNAILDSFSFQ